MTTRRGDQQDEVVTATGDSEGCGRAWAPHPGAVASVSTCVESMREKDDDRRQDFSRRRTDDEVRQT